MCLVIPASLKLCYAVVRTAGLTLSWLNLRRSLSQLKEDNRRRCSALSSDPDLDEDGI